MLPNLLYFQGHGSFKLETLLSFISYSIVIPSKLKKIYCELYLIYNISFLKLQGVLAELCCLKIGMFKYQTLVPQYVIIFGDKVFKELS